MTDAGLNEKDLFDWLWVVAKFERFRGGGRELRRNPIAGMPLYDFDRLPEKVRGWAREISRINSGLMAHPVTAHLDEFLTAEYPPSLSRLERKDRQEMLERFRILPVELIVYSRYLKVLAKMYRHFWGDMRTGLEGLREAFVLWVKERTGSQHYQQLATLLIAAYYAVGLNEQEYVLNEKSLQASYSRSTLVASLKKKAKPWAETEKLRDRALCALSGRQRHRGA